MYNYLQYSNFDNLRLWPQNTTNITNTTIIPILTWRALLIPYEYEFVIILPIFLCDVRQQLQ